MENAILPENSEVFEYFLLNIFFQNPSTEIQFIQKFPFVLFQFQQKLVYFPNLQQFEARTSKWHRIYFYKMRILLLFLSILHNLQWEVKNARRFFAVKWKFEYCAIYQFLPSSLCMSRQWHLQSQSSQKRILLNWRAINSRLSD